MPGLSGYIDKPVWWLQGNGGSGRRGKNSNDWAEMSRRGIQLLKFLEEKEMVWLSGAIPPGFGNKTPLVADQLTRAEYLRAIGGECGAQQIWGQGDGC